MNKTGWWGVVVFYAAMGLSFGFIAWAMTQGV